MRSRRRPDRVWFVLACAGSVVLVLATFARTYLAATGGAWEQALAVADLRAENNLAAWWSAMLLLMVALHAFDGFVADRGCRPRRARGWLFVALITLIFSIDELASVHERVSMAGEVSGIGGWVTLAPFGLVLLTILGAALIDLRAGRLEAHRFALIAIGFLVISSVPAQEFIEHRWPWPTPLALALRAALEEGTELLAILLLLRATVVNSTSAAGPAFEAVWRLRGPTALAALLLTPVLAIVSGALTDTFRGVPASWLGATLLLLTALALLTRDGPAGRGTICRYLAGALAVIASAAVVQLDVDSGSELAGVAVNRRLLVLVVVGLVIAATTFRQSAGRDRLVAALAVMVAGSACFLQPGSPALHMTGGIAALALYWTSSAPSRSETMAARHPAGSSYRRHAPTATGEIARNAGRRRRAAS